jgi:hypothetical protein
LVGAGKAVFLELVLLAAMILVFHVLSLAAYPANLRDAFFMPVLDSHASIERGHGEGLYSTAHTSRYLVERPLVAAQESCFVSAPQL